MEYKSLKKKNNNNNNNKKSKRKLKKVKNQNVNLNLMKYVDNFNLNLKLNLTNYISKCYNHIYSHYDKINYNIDCETIDYINKNNNLCSTFDLLSYLTKNNLIDSYNTKSLNHNGIELTLTNIIKTRNVDGCKIWINIFGKELLRNIFYLKQTGKIPLDLIKDIKSIDDDLFSEFTPIDIFEFISDNNLVKQTLKISFGKLLINLKLVSKTKLSNKKRNLIINRICLMYLIKYGDNPAPQNFTINLCILFSDHKKKLPDSYLVLGPREINSGLASYSDNKIIIYRSEEYSKLLIHELIHLLRIDFSSITIPNLSLMVDINPNIETRPNESITELLTVIINSILVAIELNLNIEDNDILLVCEKYITYEIKFNLIQCAKILHHFEYANSMDFFKKNDSNTKFNQSTSVISYFFIKTACLFNTKNTIDFLNKNFINFKVRDKQIATKQYQELVSNSLTNKRFQNIIDELLQTFINNNHKNKTQLNQTLRMTCIEVLH
jgi:hypothetical protein